MAQYGILVPFGIDNGELDDQSKEHSFCLGFEMGTIYEQMRRGDLVIEVPLFHSVNLDRVKSMLVEGGYSVSTKWANDDWLALRAQRVF